MADDFLTKATARTATVIRRMPFLINEMMSRGDGGVASQIEMQAFLLVSAPTATELFEFSSPELETKI